MTVEMIGESSKLLETKEYIRNISCAKGHVFVTGETGAGKEVFAKYLHECGNRADKPFKSLNCGALSELLIESELFGYDKGAFTGAYGKKKGAFENAEGGILFLDEFTNIKGRGYDTLLRAMNGDGFNKVGGSKTIFPNVRVVAASSSNKGLPEEMHYRFTFGTNIPTLRDRQSDILSLANHFLERGYDRKGLLPELSPDEKNALIEYLWPGNVRQLEETMNRYLTLGKIDFWEHNNQNEDSFLRTETLGRLTHKLSEEVGLKKTLKTLKLQVCDMALQKYKGNHAAATQSLLDVSYRSFRGWIK